MRAALIKKSLRRWHLAIVAVATTTVTACTLASLRLDAPTYVPIALVGYVLPFVLHGFLRRSSEAVGATPTSTGMAVSAVLLCIVMVPVMLFRTAAGVGAAVGDPRLAYRQVPLLAGWMLTLALFVVGVPIGGAAWAISGMLHVLFLAIMSWQIQSAAVEHVELQERDAFRVGDAAGHRVPVAVRS